MKVKIKLQTEKGSPLFRDCYDGNVNEEYFKANTDPS